MISMRYFDLDQAEAESEVWSPGPRAASVWLVNGAAVRWASTRDRWEEFSWDASQKPHNRYAPRLTERLWQKALSA